MRDPMTSQSELPAQFSTDKPRAVAAGFGAHAAGNFDVLCDTPPNERTTSEFDGVFVVGSNACKQACIEAADGKGRILCNGIGTPLAETVFVDARLNGEIIAKVSSKTKTWVGFIPFFAMRSFREVMAERMQIERPSFLSVKRRTEDQQR